MTGGALDPVIAAALRLAGEKGWRRTSIPEIAEASGASPATVRRSFPCKMSILVAFAQEVERRAAAAPAPFEPEDTVRDRLFELLMQRLDILEEHRGAVTSVLRDLPFDPLGAAASGPEVLRLMGGILEQAGIAAGGPVGRLRRKGLAAIWLATLYVWSGDDSPDHARTMAALDGNLRRAEPLARLLAGLPFGGGVAAAPGGF
jgi:AcrR family transcriptional regulator